MQADTDKYSITATIAPKIPPGIIPSIAPDTTAYHLIINSDFIFLT